MDTGDDELSKRKKRRNSVFGDSILKNYFLSGGKSLLPPPTKKEMDYIRPRLKWVVLFLVVIIFAFLKFMLWWAHSSY